MIVKDKKSSNFNLRERKKAIRTDWINGMSEFDIKEKYGEYGGVIVARLKKSIEKNYGLKITTYDEGIYEPVPTPCYKEILRDFAFNKFSKEDIKEKYGEYGLFVFEMTNHRI